MLELRRLSLRECKLRSVFHTQLKKKENILSSSEFLTAAETDWFLSEVRFLSYLRIC